MRRKLVNKLNEWLIEAVNTPLVITGAKGVGKTYLIFDFAKENFASNLYFNFEHDYKVRDLFSGNCDETLQNICTYFDSTIDFENTLIILDEYYLCQGAIDFVSNIKSNSNIINVICAISDTNLPPDNTRDYLNTSYDTGNMKVVRLYPFDFEEFLIATNNEWYAEAIKEHFNTNKPLPDIVHNDLLNMFNDYMYIGGMPSVINEYLLTDSYVNVTEKHALLSNSNMAALSAKIPEGEYIKAVNVYKTIPTQLMRANKKFQYSLIRKGATRKLYEKTIQYLCNTGYIVKCDRLYSENDDESFKLYMNDVGILYSTTKSIYNDEFNKSLVENYVLQNLLANDNEVYFWESKSQAKIDFVARKGKDHLFYAIEVKNGTETRSKNYSVFKETIRNNAGLIKVSAKNFSYSKGVKFIPLYAVFCI